MYKNKYDDPKEDSYFGTSFIIYLILAAIGALFLAVMGAYIYNRTLFDLPPVTIPKAFYVSTILVIMLSFLSVKALRFFDDNDLNSLFRYWSIILIVVVFFMAFQMYGWYSLIQEGYTASRNNSLGYLYALSALHLFHILIGIPFHIWLLWKQAEVFRSDQFDRFEYTAQEKNRQKLQLMTRYWHFLDGLWLLLMIFFLFNSQWIQSGITQ